MKRAAAHEEWSRASPYEACLRHMERVVCASLHVCGANASCELCECFISRSDASLNHQGLWFLGGFSCFQGQKNNPLSPLHLFSGFNPTRKRGAPHRGTPFSFSFRVLFWQNGGFVICFFKRQVRLWRRCVFRLPVFFEIFFEKQRSRPVEKKINKKALETPCFQCFFCVRVILAPIGY